MNFLNNENIRHFLKISELAGGDLQYSQFVNKVLILLIETGFVAARHYECTYNRAINDHQLILTCEMPSASQGKGNLGYAIKLKESTLGSNLDERVPAIGNSRTCFLPFVKDLKIGPNNSWIDIPIRTSDKLVGLVAAEWTEVY